MGVFKKLHIFGPTDLTEQDIQLLLSHRKAALATITCMGSEAVKKWSGPWYHSSRMAVNEDVILELPRSQEEYLHSLGHSARTQLPYYWRRVQKEWGEEYLLSYETGEGISMEMLTELVELNRIRIERQGAVHLWHRQLVEQRWRLAQDCGFFCGLRRGGKLVAGTLSYLHRNEAYLVLIGHQTHYNHLSLGKLVLWLTIQRLIQRGVTRYHLLWGKSSYKLQLGGRPHILSEVTVFRRPWVALLWHIGCVFEMLVQIGGRIARIPAGAMRRMQATISPKAVVGKGT
jgi:CelD/BcsL family acetyltransferase involved in cellulose biosynthesis